jgi:transposase
LAVENAIRPAKTEKRIALRGQALLLMADGVGPNDVARILGVNSRTAWDWKKRFVAAEDPVKALADAPRSGRPRSLSLTQTLPE